MKNKKLVHILFCMVSVFLLGCENTDLQKGIKVETQSIEVRADDCEDCPDNDCCCAIELLSGGSMDLVFCGTTGTFVSSSECEFDIMGCNLITGYYEYHTITQLDPKFIFCVSPGTGFSVGATTGTSSYRVTCQEGEFAPQSEDFNLTGPQRVYFNVDGECEVEPCP